MGAIHCCKHSKSYFNRDSATSFNFWYIYRNIIYRLFGAFFLLSKTMSENIEYSVENNFLILSHPMRTLAIDICSIKKIRRGDFLMDRGSSNFAASYPNIHILYNKNQYVYISPADEQGFLRTLQKINPNIAFSKELHIL